MGQDPHELNKRSVTPRWIVVLGGAADDARAVLEGFVASTRRFPEAVVALSGATAWMVEEWSQDAVAARVFREHGVQVVTLEGPNDIGEARVGIVGG